MHNEQQIQDRKEAFEQLAGAYGYGPKSSKNEKMWSYHNADSDERMNYYHTTGTVTIQKLGWPIYVAKGVMTEIDFENAITRKYINK